MRVNTQARRAHGPSHITRLARRGVLRTLAFASALTLAGAAALALLPAPAMAEECPNAAFRVGPSSHLPDCRAYELVTPPFKNVGFAQVEGIDPDGSSALIDLSGAIAGLEGFPSTNSAAPGAWYSLQRTATGWVVAQADDPPSSEYLPDTDGGHGLDFRVGDLDGQATLWAERAVWQPENRLDLFLRRPDHSIVDVGPTLPPTAPSGSPVSLEAASAMKVAGMSSDASHVFFSLGRDEGNPVGIYWPFDKTESGDPSLYEYIGFGNTTPLLVGVNDAGEQISHCGTVIGGTRLVSPWRDQDAENAVSTDGAMVFFTTWACEGRPNELFVRIDNGEPGAHTVAISEPSEEDCPACYKNNKLISAEDLASAEFEGASEDGSKVVFETTQPLLGGTGNNIYEYDSDPPAGQPKLIRVSGGDSTVSDPTVGLIAGTKPLISQDGSHVYFLAEGVLTTVPNRQGEAAEANTINLYMFERDASYPAGRIVFVARLSQEDVSGGFGEVGEWIGERPGGDVTPNGNFLVFVSNRDLTLDDTSTARQVFEYDAQTGALVRVSIGQDGFNDNGNALLKLGTEPSNLGDVVNDPGIAKPEPQEGVYETSEYWKHESVSANGSYVFFESPVRLTPQAQEGARNVYEYHDGRVSSIAGNSFLLGTDESGGDIFFETVVSLVGQDTDTAKDIYDARIDGGFPAPAAPAPCVGEECQGQLSGAPTLLSPGSEFQAGSNPPLAGEPVAASKAKPKSKKKSKKAGGVRHAKRRGGKAKRAAVGGRADRKAGRR
jgi:hypothetical protein